jgi:anti-sigma factor RsiW
MQCTEFRDALEQYLDDVLDESPRESFRRHLRACPECRTWAVGVEPTLVFAAMEAPVPDSDRVAACTASVMAQIRQKRLARGLRPHRRRWLAAAAAVLVAIAGGTGWWLAQNDRQSSPAAAVEARDESDSDALPPRVQVNMPGEGVRVYQFADDENHNTAMYYIVNPALES